MVISLLQNYDMFPLRSTLCVNDGELTVDLRSKKKLYNFSDVCLRVDRGRPKDLNYWVCLRLTFDQRPGRHDVVSKVQNCARNKHSSEIRRAWSIKSGIGQIECKITLFSA
jgi:hypothetical protein